MSGAGGREHGGGALVKLFSSVPQPLAHPPSRDPP